MSAKKNGVKRFQSTLPVRGATVDGKIYVGALKISIHAPRAGSDWGDIDDGTVIEVFQSTLPVRGATKN